MTETEPRTAAVQYAFTESVSQLLAGLKSSLLITTYQAQRIMTVAPAADGKLNSLMRIFERPTGVALNGTTLALASKSQIWFFENAGEIRGEDGSVLPYDICFTPRRSFVTGDIASHQLAWHNDELLIVNTRFSCLSTLSNKWSFIPGWRPPFISAIAPEDRCHLNGVCIDENGPKYASALGMTDTKEGWRENKASGGIIIDIPSGEVVTEGLSMPHSPVLYAGKLWILNSGTGALEVVDEKDGKRTTVAKFPGFLRGLDFCDRYAFVGLCKIRNDRKTFNDLPIEKETDELKCAVCILDITTGNQVGFFEFTRGVEELFDIKIIRGSTNPHIIGFEEDTIQGLFVIDPDIYKKAP